jgi:transcriptional regulator with XRE-family HTH domain
MLTAESITSNAKMPNRIWERFGPWLQAEREATGVSQADAAKAAGLHVVQLSRIENGRSGAKRETVIAVVNAVNKLSKGHQIELDKALRQAGFAGDPNTPIRKKPETMQELLDFLDSIGISHINFFDPEKYNSPEAIQRALDTIEFALNYAIERGDIPAGDVETPSTRPDPDVRQR